MWYHWYNCFDKCFLFHVITERHYFLYIFIVTKRFGTTAMLLFSLKQVFWKKSTFQRRISVVSMLWINVEIILIWRWKWNKIRRWIFNVAERWYNVSVRRRNSNETTLHNVDTTLGQRRFNVVLTLIKTTLEPIGLVMIMDLEIDE